MAAKFTDNPARGRDLANAIRSCVMIALTLIFILLYGAALLGWLKPLTDEKMVSRLEPIIFVIIGYYFGRVPSEQNENTLRNEISRQTQKADAAQHAKEQAQQARESLEEKLKNARAALAASPSAAGLGRLSENHDKPSAQVKEEALRQSVAAALNILNS
ncbi:MAG TPA: hypothetical protein VF762_15410 [Blastocatellia bacterium]|jgi:hypothetical protein